MLLAVKDINAANLGVKIELTLGDSGDPDNKAYATTVPKLLNQKVSAIVGAAASGVSKLVIDQVIGAGTILFSPSNTSPDFTDLQGRRAVLPYRTVRQAAGRGARQPDR